MNDFSGITQKLDVFGKLVDIVKQQPKIIYKTTNIPPEEIGALLDLVNELLSIEKCMAFAPNEEAREGWRIKYKDMSMQISMKFDYLIVKYIKLPNKDKIITIAPTPNYFNNTITLEIKTL